MQIEDYFDFLAPDDIRMKGTRVGIESILYEYVHREQAPEAIARRFPTLALGQVYSAILYYLRNREKMDAYLADWLAWGYHTREEQGRNPSPFVEHMHALKKRQSSYSLDEQ